MRLTKEFLSLSLTITSIHDHLGSHLCDLWKQAWGKKKQFVNTGNKENLLTYSLKSKENNSKALLSRMCVYFFPIKAADLKSDSGLSSFQTSFLTHFVLPKVFTPHTAAFRYPEQSTLRRILTSMSLHIISNTLVAKIILANILTLMKLKFILLPNVVHNQRRHNYSALKT